MRQAFKVVIISIIALFVFVIGLLVASYHAAKIIYEEFIKDKAGW